MKTCRRGHERTQENTGHYSDGTRYCIPCRRITSNRYKPQNALNMQRRMIDLKIQVHNAYGAICKCCGDDTPEFLHLDHVNDDGAQHRKEIGNSAQALLRWAKNNGYPSRLQLLCFNCGMAKQYSNGCPHIKRKLNCQQLKKQKSLMSNASLMYKDIFSGLVKTENG